MGGETVTVEGRGAAPVAVGPAGRAEGRRRGGGAAGAPKPAGLQAASTALLQRHRPHLRRTAREHAPSALEGEKRGSHLCPIT